MNKTWIGILGCLLVIAGACGDDDGDGYDPPPGGDGAGNGGSATNVPATAELSSLSETEFSAVCDDLGGYADEFSASTSAKTGFCLWAAIAIILDPETEMDGDLLTACGELVDACESGLNPAAIEEAVGTLTGGLCDGGPPASCSLTVGDMDECMRQGLDALMDVGESSTCMSVSEDGVLSGMTAPPPLPATCEMILEATCE